MGIDTTREDDQTTSVEALFAARGLKPLTQLDDLAIAATDVSAPPGLGRYDVTVTDQKS
jgi:hypothetical protein